jgi:hypothetical protein
MEPVPSFLLLRMKKKGLQCPRGQLLMGPQSVHAKKRLPRCLLKEDLTLILARKNVLYLFFDKKKYLGRVEAFWLEHERDPLQQWAKSRDQKDPSTPRRLGF